MAGNSKDPGRSVISKISAILLATTDGRGRTLTEIATWSDMPLSTVHRLVTELAAWGLPERDDDGRYRVGPSLRGTTADRTSLPAEGEWGLRDSLAPVMDDLFRSTGAAVRGGWLAGHEVAYVEKVLGHVPVTQPSTAAQLRAHATALGKALLAFSPGRVVDAGLARGLRCYTDLTITRPVRLRCGPRWPSRRRACRGTSRRRRTASLAPVRGPGRRGGSSAVGRSEPPAGPSAQISIIDPMTTVRSTGRSK